MQSIMNVYLYQNGKQMRLPVPITGYTLGKTLNTFQNIVQGVGEQVTPGERNQDTLTFETWLPDETRNFKYIHREGGYNFPSDYVNRITEWQNQPIRVIITNSPDNINDNFILTSFDLNKDPSNGFNDLDISFSFTKYLNAYPSDRHFAGNGKIDPNPLQFKPKTYLIKANDIKGSSPLNTISRKLYGISGGASLLTAANPLLTGTNYNSWVGQTIIVP